MGFNYGYMSSPIQNATIKIGPLECSIVPGCEEYEVLDDPSRKSSYGKEHPVQCDVSNNSCTSKDWKGPKWYRIMAGAWSSLATSVVNEKHCDTMAVGFIKHGKHPSVIGSTIKATVCFNFAGFECLVKSDIEIKHCGNYNLYNLPEVPGFGYRYCTEWFLTNKSEIKKFYSRHDNLQLHCFPFIVNLHDVKKWVKAFLKRKIIASMSNAWNALLSKRKQS